MRIETWSLKKGDIITINQVFLHHSISTEVELETDPFEKNGYLLVKYKSVKPKYGYKWYHTHGMLRFDEKKNCWISHDDIRDYT